VLVGREEPTGAVDVFAIFFAGSITGFVTVIEVSDWLILFASIWSLDTLSWLSDRTSFKGKDIDFSITGSSNSSSTTTKSS